MLKLIRLNIKAFFIYTTCLSDPVKKSSKLDLQGLNLNPYNPQVIDIEKKLPLNMPGIDLGSMSMQKGSSTTALTGT